MQKDDRYGVRSYDRKQYDRRNRDDYDLTSDRQDSPRLSRKYNHGDRLQGDRDRNERCKLFWCQWNMNCNSDFLIFCMLRNINVVIFLIRLHGDILTDKCYVVKSFASMYILTLVRFRP